MIELNKIYNEDCLETLSRIEDNSIDLIVTSPPYNKGYFNKLNGTHSEIWSGAEIDYDAYDDNLPLEEYEQLMIKVLNECFRVIKENGSIFFNHKPIRVLNKIYHPIKFLLEGGFPIYQEIVWNRKNSPNVRVDLLLPCTERIFWISKGKPKFYKNKMYPNLQSEVWDIIVGKSEHPAPFPSKLVDNCILGCTDEGDVVYDPFMGSGTTAVACMKRNRSFIGSEISEHYVNMANRRIEVETSQLTLF